MKHLFGGLGDAPTEFERALLARADTLDDRWVGLGRRIGIEALFVVLDELGGGETLYVPTREKFVQRLYLPLRDAEIAALLREGVDRKEIARTYRITPQAVSDANSRALRQLAGDSAKSGA